MGLKEKWPGFVSVSKDFLLSRTLIILFTLLVSYIGHKLTEHFRYDGDQLTYTFTEPKRQFDEKFYSGCLLCKDSINELYVDFILCNKGEKHLDFSRILNDRKMLIYSKNEVQNLQILDIVKSRANLRIAVTIENEHTIALNFSEDEALEELDGLQLKFKYTGTSTTPWQLRERVKGYPKGISYLSPLYFISKDLLQGPMRVFGIMCIMGIFIVLTGVLPFYEVGIVRYFWIAFGVAFLAFGAYFLIKDDRLNFRRPAFVESEMAIEQSKYLVDCPTDLEVQNFIKAKLRQKYSNNCE